MRRDAAFIKAEQRKDFDAIANGDRHQKSR